MDTHAGVLGEFQTHVYAIVTKSTQIIGNNDNRLRGTSKDDTGVSHNHIIALSWDMTQSQSRNQRNNNYARLR